MPPFLPAYSGEHIYSLNGAEGGLERSSHRIPNSRFVISSCAFGTGHGVPYKTTEAAHDEGFQSLWHAMSEDERQLVGEKGFGGGASGDEIDRLDFSLGTPSNAVLLATSTRPDESFGVFNEIMFLMVKTWGTTGDKVTGDMVYYETSKGGSVFIVGSSNWYCSLGWDGYTNSCAAVTWHVIKEF